MADCSLFKAGHLVQLNALLSIYSVVFKVAKKVWAPYAQRWLKVNKSKLKNVDLDKNADVDKCELKNSN